MSSAEGKLDSWNERQPAESGAYPRGAGKVAARELTNAGYASVEQLSGVSVATLLRIHGVGPKAIRVIEETLAERNLPPMAP
jgi:hypothetical protein